MFFWGAVVVPQARRVPRGKGSTGAMIVGGIGVFSLLNKLTKYFVGILIIVVLRGVLLP